MQEHIAQFEAHRPALMGHCYRMLGSAAEADDAVQETLLRAWKALERFDGRASLRTWLYRIATNVCLDTLNDKPRRFRPLEEGPPGSTRSTLTQKPRTHWLEPIADAAVLPSDANPAELFALRQSIRLAFVAALQHLAPKQRAVLLLTEVLGWSAAEVAESLETSVAAVNSALQRARAVMATRPEGSASALSESQKDLLERYVGAFEAYDVDALAGLLREDATFSMPPYALWLQGPERVREWLTGPGAACRGSRMLPAAACGMPTFAQYRPHPEGGHFAWGLVVLELDGDRISDWNTFLDAGTIFPRFGLPLRLPG
jgi:RNA polymerase sigma-70 factor (ECF subfamily)